jgi:hypothetical protein
LLFFMQLPGESSGPISSISGSTANMVPRVLSLVCLQGYGCHKAAAQAAANGSGTGRYCIWLDRYQERQLAQGLWLARYMELHQPFAGGRSAASCCYRC